MKTKLSTRYRQIKMNSFRRDTCLFIQYFQDDVSLGNKDRVTKFLTEYQEHV